MKQFKKEYQGCKMIIKTHTVGKIEIDTTTADPEKWSKIEELAFMIEEIQYEQPKAKVNKVVIEQAVENTEEEDIYDVDYSEYTLNELREVFPKIKATSKSKFLELIESLK